MGLDDRSGGDLLLRVARILVPWVALVVVVVVIFTIFGDYRAATRQDETTESVETSSSALAGTGEPYVSVLADGLNLRTEASTSAAVVVVLDKGQRLIYVDETTGWYHVKTEAGAEGWVAAGGRYTELVRP